MPVPSCRPRFTLPLAAVGFAFLIAAAPVPVRASQVLGDGAVVDSIRGIAYLAQPQGGIEALDLSTGQAVWRSAAAAKPLALAGGTGEALLAQMEPGTGGVLRIATLDPRTGAEKGRGELALPAGLWASVTDNLRGTFRLRAAAVHDGGSILLAWTATAAAPLHGFVPPDLSLRVPIGAAVAAPTPAAKVGGFERGAARLDPVTGRITPVADSEVVALAAAIDRGLAPGGAAEVAGASGPSGFASIDGRHALTSERVAGSLHTYRWSISVRQTGSVLAVLDVPVSFAPFVVVGGKVIYLAQPSLRRENGVTIGQPLRLRALDLQTGAESWQAVVRDSAYRGPIPP
ncbi:MAG: hypothetical protein ABJC13_04505 [Acidobacteriota bacterium]